MLSGLLAAGMQIASASGGLGGILGGGKDSGGILSGSGGLGNLLGGGAGLDSSMAISEATSGDIYSGDMGTGISSKMIIGAGLILIAVILVGRIGGKG